MLKKIERYVHTDGSVYGEETAQDAFNQEQKRMRVKRIADELKLTSNHDNKLSLSDIVEKFEVIVGAILNADRQVTADNRQFIYDEKIGVNEIPGLKYFS